MAVLEREPFFRLRRARARRENLKLGVDKKIRVVYNMIKVKGRRKRYG